MVTPRDLTMTIARLVKAYKLGTYYFHNENFVNIKDLKIENLPVLLFFQNSATAGKGKISIKFELKIIRTEDDFKRCTFDLTGALDGTNPPDKMDYEFIDYLLQALQNTVAGCGKKWQVETSGNVTVGKVDVKDIPNMQGAYLFMVDEITTTVEQQQIQNIASNPNFFAQ